MPVFIKIPCSRIAKLKFELIVFCLCTFISILVSASPAGAINCSLPVQDEWKNHFPFDLVYPAPSEFQPSSECPTINFWGKDRSVCSIQQLTQILKNLILARVSLRGLFSV